MRLLDCWRKNEILVRTVKKCKCKLAEWTSLSGVCMFRLVNVQLKAKAEKFERQNLSAARTSVQPSRGAILRFEDGASGAPEPRPKNCRMLRLEARSDESACESRAGRPFVFSLCFASGSVSVRARFFECPVVTSFSTSPSESSSPSDLSQRDVLTGKI